MVPVMVHRSVAHIVFVHKIHHLHYCLLIVRGISVHLHIENMATASQLMIRCLNLSFVARRTMITNWYMI